jgi:hypothetical protein
MFNATNEILLRIQEQIDLYDAGEEFTQPSTFPNDLEWLLGEYERLTEENNRLKERSN